MDMNSRSGQILKGLATVAISGPCLYAGTGLHPIWWLTWIAPLPVLLFATQASVPATGVVALSAWLTGGLNMWHYLHDVIQLPAGIVVLASLVPALAFLLVTLNFRLSIKNGQFLKAAFVAPAIWVVYEYLYMLASPHSTFGSLVYSQMDFLPVLQLASITGLWGILFLLFLVPAATVAILAAPVREKTVIAAVAVALMAFVLSFGWWRLSDNLQATGTVTVALIGSDASKDIFPAQDPQSLELLRRYADQMQAHDVDVFLIPEKLALIGEAAGETAREMFQAVATRTGATVVVGLDEKRGNGRWNEALIFSKAGGIATYEKHHFIPGIEEGYVLGKDVVTFSRPSGKWGVQICKDLDFPRLSRLYGGEQTGLLLVPAWDFTIDGWLHARMAILRGVESGFTIARAAKQGLLTVSDNRGRLLLDKPGSPEGFVVAQVRAPVAHADTIYGRFGDWFAWICTAAVFVLLIGRISSAFR